LNVKPGPFNTETDAVSSISSDINMPTFSANDPKIYFRLYTLVWLFLILLIAGLIITGVGPKDYLLSESGPIETLSAIGHLLCAAVIIRLAGDWSGRWPAAGLLMLFALREMDFHSRFTTMNLSKSRFYLSPEVGMIEKLIGGAVIALFLYCIYRLFRLEGRTWLVDLKRGRACAYGILFALTCIVVAKSLDGFARKLADIGILVSSQASSYASTFEEVLELGIPIMIGLSIACYYRRRRNGA
jgi:hypothetical protein